MGTGECLQVLRQDSDPLGSATFSPDGLLAITPSANGSAIIWRVPEGHVQMTLQGHVGQLCEARFSPNGYMAITAASDWTAKIWSAESGHCLQTLSGHQGALCSVVFHPKLQRASAQAFQCVKGEEAFALGEALGDEIMPIFPVAERRRSGG